MSIPIMPDVIKLELNITTSQLESLLWQAEHILSTARKFQEEYPDMHWSTEWADKEFGEDNKKMALFYSVVNPLYILGTQKIKINIIPDKRHKGCSGYCHY